MLNKEDSRRLAQLERQLKRDDPEFCARMAAGRPSRRRVPMALVFVAVVVWIAALVLGVTGWWIAAAICAACATLTVIAIAYHCRPLRRVSGLDPMPPAW